jgi:hypothetical protein
MGSRSIGVHVAKGFVGFTSVWIALKFSSVLGWWTLIPATVALLAFKGCPMCWTVGLLETVLHRKDLAECKSNDCKIQIGRTQTNA